MLYCLQHSDTVPPLNVAAWAEERNLPLEIRLLHRGDPLPDPGDVDRIVIMGGEMNTFHEEAHPWLVPEKEFLRELVALDGVRAFGICLGAQLLAEALGAEVRLHDNQEIGWWPMSLTDAGRTSQVFGALPDAFPVFLWHECTFDLPDAATLTVTGPGCRNQGFEYAGRIFGVQFHPEFTRDHIEGAISRTKADLTVGGYVQTADQLLHEPERFHASRAHLFDMLDRAFGVRGDAPNRAEPSLSSST